MRVRKLLRSQREQEPHPKFKQQSGKNVVLNYTATFKKWISGQWVSRLWGNNPPKGKYRSANAVP